MLARLRLQRLHQRREQPLGELQHVFLLDEGHLHVQLGELRLAVGAQVLVAEAAGDLEVALEARDHEKLLELLRRLRQGVESARMHAAGHDVVPRPLRRAFDEDRRFDLHEVTSEEVCADELHHTAAQQDIALHAGAAQVQVAIPQPQRLGNLGLFVDVKRRCVRGVEDLYPPGGDLDLACGQAGVLQARRPLPHRAFYLQHILAARLAGHPVGFRRGLRIAHHLRDAIAVTQVNEDEATVVAAAMHPARQRHRRAHVFPSQLTAIVSLQHDRILLQSLAGPHYTRKSPKGQHRLGRLKVGGCF